ncbi:hypothetical protein [Embleya sp. NBC_00888]|uniref:hypothetical protein n=1 Tax=Embleya sp. NBC_00888 TaxID=2975960 RepID=UPI002F90E880
MSVENFHTPCDRGTLDRPADTSGPGARVNLLTWDGDGRPAGLFPEREEGDTHR